MSSPIVQFGNPDLWPKTYAALQGPLDAIKSLESLVSDILNGAASSRGTKAQRIIEMFARTAARSFHDLVILVGNGCGTGAMILSRGMFEYAVMAEYLRQNPREQADYTAFGVVTSWQTAEEIKPEVIAELRRRYSRAAARMKDKNGKLRRQWHRKPLRNMAEEIGLGEQYALPYGLAASMHHGSFEGVAAQFGVEGDVIIFGEPSADGWIDAALISGHIYLLQILETLNRAMRLGFKTRLAKAIEDFQCVWKAQGQKRTSA